MGKVLRIDSRKPQPPPFKQRIVQFAESDDGIAFLFSSAVVLLFALITHILFRTVTLL